MSLTSSPSSSSLACRERTPIQAQRRSLDNKCAGSATHRRSSEPIFVEDSPLVHREGASQNRLLCLSPDGRYALRCVGGAGGSGELRLVGPDDSRRSMHAATAGGGASGNW